MHAKNLISWFFTKQTLEYARSTFSKYASKYSYVKFTFTKYTSEYSYANPSINHSGIKPPSCFSYDS